MLEFNPNTIAIMTASLEQCCKKLKQDTPDARKYIADKLKESARRGRVSMVAMTEVGEDAVSELNRAAPASGWFSKLRWPIQSR
jgi:hypothetical protein